MWNYISSSIFCRMPSTIGTGTSHYLASAAPENLLVQVFKYDHIAHHINIIHNSRIIGY